MAKTCQSLESAASWPVLRADIGGHVNCAAADMHNGVLILVGANKWACLSWLLQQLATATGGNWQCAQNHCPHSHILCIYWCSC